MYRLWGSWLAHHAGLSPEPSHTIFVTASATLRDQVMRAFRRLQAAVLSAEEAARRQGVASAAYHTFRAIPSDAFPLFLLAK